MSKPEIQKHLSNCTYIQVLSSCGKETGANLLLSSQDESIEVEGIRFYGTPWTSSTRMAFSATRKELRQKWSEIPAGIDVLITPLPPHSNCFCCVLIFRSDSPIV